MYFGWMIVVMAVITYMVSMGTSLSAYGLFVVPVSAEFDLSRADMNSGLILVNIGNALLAPFVGRLLDRFPARRIMMVGAVLFGTSLVALGMSHSLWVDAAILLIVLPAGVQCVALLTVSVLIARWFAARRARAMMLGAMGMSLSTILVTPLVAWLVEHEGWRYTLIIAGAASTCILIVIAALMREYPGSEDVEVTGAGGVAGIDPAQPLAPPLPVAAILRLRHFWLIAVAVSITMGISQAIVVSFVPLALESRLTVLQGTSLLSITGGAAITTKLILSIFADRIDRTVLLSCLIGLASLASAGLYASSGYATLAGSAIIVGITAGAVPPLFYALIADRFGIASFGTVRGLMAPITGVLAAVATRLAGEIYDRTGGYAMLFLIFLVAQLVAAVMIYASRPTFGRRSGRHAGGHAHGGLAPEQKQERS